jgi:hypothetical protein
MKKSTPGINDKFTNKRLRPLPSLHTPTTTDTHTTTSPTHTHTQQHTILSSHRIPITIPSSTSIEMMNNDLMNDSIDKKIRHGVRHSASSIHRSSVLHSHDHDGDDDAMNIASNDTSQMPTQPSINNSLIQPPPTDTTHPSVPHRTVHMRNRSLSADTLTRDVENGWFGNVVSMARGFGRVNVADNKREIIIDPHPHSSCVASLTRYSNATSTTPRIQRKQPHIHDNNDNNDINKK